MPSLLVRTGTTSLKTQNQVVSDPWLHGSFLRGGLLKVGLTGGAQGNTNPPAACLPALGSWQELLSGRFQDALVLSHASAGIHHLIKEGCGHPAVTVRRPHCHVAAQAVCWERNKRRSQNGSQTCQDARDRCGVEETGKICAIEKSSR